MYKYPTLAKFLRGEKHENKGEKGKNLRANRNFSIAFDYPMR